MSAPDAVESVYDAFAEFYDDFTADHRYEALTRDLERLAREHGAEGRRLLDIACGTGRSFEPFLQRGFAVTATDISHGMLSRARQRAGSSVRLVHADARDLPELGKFDLVTCLDDSLNYLLDAEDLTRALRGARRALAAGAIFVFDVSTLFTYRTIFAQTSCVERNARFFAWRGETDPDAPSGVRASAAIDVFSREADGLWSRHASRHVQRHHADSVVRAAAAAAGLATLAVHGLTPDGRIHPGVNELSHTKRIYVTGRAPCGRLRP